MAKKANSNIVCPICKHEHDPASEPVTCEACGAFLVDHGKLRDQMTRNYKGKESLISTPQVMSQHPYCLRKRPIIPTPSLRMDYELGGGFPIGSKIELIAPESCGKSSFAVQQTAIFQKRNASTFYIDNEGTTGRDDGFVYMRQLGVDVDRLYYVVPESGTHAIDLIGENCDKFSFITLDSVATLARSTFLQKDAKALEKGSNDVQDQQDYAGPAALMNLLQNKHNGKIIRHDTTILLLNQARDNQTPAGTFGIRGPGGRPLKHFTTHRIQFLPIMGSSGEVVQDGEVVGFKVRARVLKNKQDHAGAEFELSFLYGVGFSRDQEYIDIALELGILNLSGSWYKDADGNTLAQGSDALHRFFLEQEEEYEKFKRKVEDKMKEKFQRNNPNDEN